MTTENPQLLPNADAAATYLLVHRRIDELVRSRAGIAELTVPACPAWTIRDTIAHLTGVAEDIVALNMEHKGTDPWARAQVERLGGHTIGDLLDRWGQLIEQVTTLLALAPQRSVCQLVFDTLTHEHDIRGALNEPGSRTGDPAFAAAIGFVTTIGDQFIRHEALPAVRLTTPTTSSVQLGDPQAAPGRLALDISDFEALRSLGGRRSIRQLLALPWQGDPTHFLPAFTHHLPAFTNDGIQPPVDDLIE